MATNIILIEHEWTLIFLFEKNIFTNASLQK